MSTLAEPGSGSAPAPGHDGPGLPERDRVSWRRRVDERELRLAARGWTGWTVGHTVPFCAAALLLAMVKPVLIPISLILIAHAWIIPELYASRGAGVLRERTPQAAGPEARALLLLGDLIDDANRRLHERTQLILAPGTLGTWVVGEAGALLVRPGGRRVNCYCVHVPAEELPHGDRVAHLLLALRCDEADFATVANLAFSGAPWRLRRRMRPHQRAALDAAVATQLRGQRLGRRLVGRRPEGAWV